MRTETALLRLLRKLQSMEASRDRMFVAEAVVVTVLEILEARFALLHGIHHAPQGYVTNPLAWVIASGESGATHIDHPESHELRLQAEPLLADCVTADAGFATRAERDSFALAFRVGPAGSPVAVVEAHCTAQPSDALVECIGELIGIYAEHIGLLDYAELDTLTRLNNRKTFDENFDRFIDLAGQSSALGDSGLHAPCWLAVVDIDRFKRINDTFGHLFGDEVLLRVADLMKKSFRGSDKLFRFGGEEFVILLRNVPASTAETVLERMRATIEEHEFPQVGQVTCSIGYVQIDASLTPAEILGRADEALYFCKGNGRNQVQCHENLVDLGLIAAPTQTAEVNSDLQADIDALFS